ncbi:hypothetical protein [Helicobacter mesocricetorum]|uniref:hypothetical protein n=1 Tax=Helicobacter mesocricetorum TaxID=87012 RepID=UPI000CF132C2|nr:hypothetical protein [Helicobacter mesocricetorum]
MPNEVLGGFVVAYLPLKEIAFYSLEINEEKLNKECLRDSLEEQICLIFGLKRDCEYFLSFNNALNPNLFYCIVVCTDSFTQYSTKDTTFLTNPIFLTQVFLPNDKDFNVFIIADIINPLDIGIIVYYQESIIFLDILEHKEIVKSLYKIEQEITTDFYLWCENDNLRQSLKQYINKEIRLVDVYEHTQNLLDYPKVLNFIPTKEIIPFWRQNVGKLILISIMGMLLGISYPLTLEILAFLEQRHNEDLKQQIQSQQLEYKKYSGNKKDFKALSEKYFQLQEKIAFNKAYLEKFIPKQSPMIFFAKAKESLAQNNIKIAYFHYSQDAYEMLLIGEYSLKFIEFLEQKGLGVLELLEPIQSFYFVRLKS